jgi:hypothetical protein
MSSPVSYDLQGQGGGVVLGSGSTQSSATGDFRWIQVITDAVLGSITSTNLAEGSALAGPTLVAGLGIGGRFSGITVSSGLVIAYYA